ncbi:MAG: SsrA-binding protein [Candidatus Omnitrophota bacterium]|nr:MAG: SsrA-binding protein [Candidatus Omnitrophota bacterium]
METKTLATNKRAGLRYEFLDKFEAGIELRGSEVKSLRQSKVDLSDSFVRIDNGEAFIHNLHISPYKQASYENVSPLRIRKILLHKQEIIKLFAKMKQKSLTIIPLSLYFNQTGRVKLNLALAKGRRLYDQREKIKKKEFLARMQKIGVNKRM